MSLLMERVDPYTIRLMGRWHRDTMLCYLHTTAKNFMGGLAICMFQYGNYALILPLHTNV